MKKFSFSLEKLLKYKEQIKDSEKATLMGFVSEKNSLVNKRESLQLQQDNVKRKITSSMSKGIKASDVNTYNFIIENCRTQIHFLNRDISILQKKIEQQQEIVFAISKEVQSIEKLKEKKLEEYNENLLKEQNKVIEYYVSQKAFERLQNE